MALRMQHLKRKHKRSVEVQDSNTKEAQGNNEEIHEVGSQLAHGAPDSEQYLYGVHGLSGGTPDSLRREAHNQALSSYSTGLSGVHRTVFVTVDCYRPQRLTAIDPNGRLTWPGHQTVNSRCPVHRTVQRARRQKQQLFCPTANESI
jgi:hypothetical protein